MHNNKSNKAVQLVSIMGLELLLASGGHAGMVGGLRRMFKGAILWAVLLSLFAGCWWDNNRDNNGCGGRGAGARTALLSNGHHHVPRQVQLPHVVFYGCCSNARGNPWQDEGGGHWFNPSGNTMTNAVRVGNVRSPWPQQITWMPYPITSDG